MAKHELDTKAKLNKEFDDLRLQAKWCIEDLIEKIHYFEPIFTGAKGAEHTKAELQAILAKLSKL